MSAGASGEGTLSPAEARFDRARRRIGLAAGPLLLLLIWLLPLPVSPPAHRLAALLVLVVVFWITEPVPLAVTALLGPVLAVAAGVGEARDVLASFANPIIFLLLGSFFIARAMEVHHLDRRFSLFILSRSWIGGKPNRILLAVGMVAAAISMWISNTAATAMVYPVALGLIAPASDVPGRGGAARTPYAAGVLLMVAYAASIGGIATPIGTPTNLIGIGMISRMANVRIPFFQWMSFALPLTLLMFAALYLLLIRGGGVVPARPAVAFAPGPFSRGEINTAISFGVAVLLWLTPGFIALVWGAQSDLYRTFDRRLPEGGVAILAASLLFLLPTDFSVPQFTLNWEDAQKIDWGTILLFGGGLALGDLMFKTGLSETIGRGLMRLLDLKSLWGITGFAIFLGIVISELTSNTASASMVVPVVIALAQSSAVSPIPPALGATLGASFGFMLPISTPPNAIVYGSGLIPIHRMLRAGIAFDIIGFFLIWGGLRFLCPLLGLL